MSYKYLLCACLVGFWDSDCILLYFAQSCSELDLRALLYASGISSLRDNHGYLHSEAKDKAEILNAQLKYVYTQEDHTNIPHKGPLPYSAMQHITITVFKKNDKNTASNYRPVSLTSILCKTLEHTFSISALSFASLCRYPWLSLNEDIPDASCFLLLI
jgi:hypothetical protein